MTYRNYEEALADPATTPGVRLRIQADLFGEALFSGVRRHAERRGLEVPPGWYEMTSWERGSYWRPAIYDMLETMKVAPL